MSTRDLTTPPTSDDEGYAPIKTPVNVKEMRSLSLSGSDDLNDEYHDEGCDEVQPKRKRKSPSKTTKSKKRKAEEETTGNEEDEECQNKSPLKKRAQPGKSGPWTQEEDFAIIKAVFGETLPSLPKAEAEKLVQRFGRSANAFALRYYRHIRPRLFGEEDVKKEQVSESGCQSLKKRLKKLD